MKPKDYADIMRLSPEEREKKISESREVVFAEGATANTVLSYLSEYFDKKTTGNFVKFMTLKPDATLADFQAVWNDQNALQNLYEDLTKKIQKTERLQRGTKETSANI